VSAASTGSGVDVTSSVSEARNSDAADLGWKNILVRQFEEPEGMGFVYRFVYFKKKKETKVQGWEKASKGDDLLRAPIYPSNTRISHYVVYLMYILSSWLV
jgi:hypothetical protein